MGSKSSAYDLSKEEAILTQKLNSELGFPSEVLEEKGRYACKTTKRLHTYDGVIPQIGDAVFIHKNFAKFDVTTFKSISDNPQPPVDTGSYIIEEFDIAEKCCSVTVRSQNSQEAEESESITYSMSSFKYLKTTPWTASDYRKYYVRNELPYLLVALVAVSVPIIALLGMVYFVVFSPTMMEEIVGGIVGVVAELTGDTADFTPVVQALSTVLRLFTVTVLILIFLTVVKRVLFSLRGE